MWWSGVFTEGDARGQLVTLDADGAVVSVSERAEEADEAPPASAAADAWGPGPHEARLGACVSGLCLSTSAVLTKM